MTVGSSRENDGGILTITLNTAIFFLILLSGAMAAGDETFSSAGVYIRQGAFLEAICEYDAIYRDHPDPSVKAEALYFSASTYAGYLNRYTTALRLFDTLIERFPDSPYAEDALFTGGTILYRKGDYAHADRIFQMYERRYPRGHHAAAVAGWLETIRQRGNAQSLPPSKTAPAFDRLPEIIRVLLVEKKESAIISAPGGLLVRTPKSAWRLIPKDRVVIQATAQGVFIPDRNISGRSLILKGRNGSFDLNGCEYRGELDCIGDGRYLKLVNRVALESYLYGVIPSEMPSSWPLQALKAQAVAARTYAVYMTLKSPDPDVDVTANTRSQVYGGLTAETAAAREAVDATRGQVMIYDGYPILAYFHSDSGGFTEDPRHVWGTGVPYLQSRADPMGMNPESGNWTLSLSLRQIEQRLRQAGVTVRGLRMIAPGKRSFSGRVTEVLLTGSRGVRKTLSGNRFRMAVGPMQLRSLKFDLTVKNRVAHFTGTGFGHGVGMSQWGARRLAENGLDYSRILQSYYQGIRIFFSAG